MDNLNIALFIGKVSFGFESLPSTNTFALELLSKQNPPEGSIIVTDNQTAGRGQLSKTWESAPGKNITLSVILYPTFLSPIKNTILNQSIALGVHDFIHSLVKKNISIKWPNDIICNERKIAGILIQNSLQGEHLQHSIVGIGINVNQTAFNNAEKPTSVFLETGLIHEIDQLIPRLCAFLEYRYMQLKNGQYAEIKADYHRHLYQLNEKKDYIRISTGEIFTAKLLGIDEEGRLNLETTSGPQLFNLHEIRFV